MRWRGFGGSFGGVSREGASWWWSATTEACSEEAEAGAEGADRRVTVDARADWAMRLADSVGGLTGLRCMIDDDDEGSGMATGGALRGPLAGGDVCPDRL